MIGLPSRVIPEMPAPIAIPDCRKGASRMTGYCFRGTAAPDGGKGKLRKA
jgi:hypothetical protein